jgi:pilus assembly protein FimV
VSAPQPLGSPVTAADAFSVSTVIDEDEPARLPPTRPAPFVPAAVPASAQTVPEAPRELSVEELIDLEQQAEFFIVLGQDEAAVELLMSHVRSDGGISPLPYLKLLEIYRRRGDQDAYQRIRERFNRRFNAYAPDWDSDLQRGRSLIDYPETIARLQQLWASPVRVMETLDASLFRRNKTDETFDLPAYRELLFLYSIARDLAEHAGELPATAVDLLLPLDDAGAEPIARLSATTRPGDFQHSDMMTMPLDLDVSFGPGRTQGVETVPSALRRAVGQASASDPDFVDFDLDPPARAPRAGSNR